MNSLYKHGIKDGVLNERTNERTNERSLFANEGVNNDWLPVEAEAHQSWPKRV